MLHNGSYAYTYFFWILRPIKMKLGQILVCCLTNIFNIFLAQCCRLQTSSRSFYDFIKTTIGQDLAVFNSWRLPFLIVSYSPFQKMHHWNLNIIGPWVIWAGCYIGKNLEPSPTPPNCLKDSWKLLLLLISISWPGLVTWWVVVQKILSKMHPVSRTNTHHDVTGSLNNGMVKNMKTWISWEQNKTFLRNKKILSLCYRWHILRSYTNTTGNILLNKCSRKQYINLHILKLI